MGKRGRSHETDDERRRRKRHKEAKKKRKRDHELSKASHADTILTTTAAQTTSDGPAAFYKKRLELTVSILPAGLGDVDKSIDENLRLFLCQFSGGIGGVLLAFSNVVVKEDGKGMILNELPYIHYSVACDALVFCPTVGVKLVGVVTSRSFHSHLSLVVHHYFNACIPAEHLRSSGLEFDEIQEQWYRIDTSQVISPGVQVEFVVDKVHESGGIVSVDGSKPTLL
jgi:DNA-directed RNA polymerase subunit E'/Rpb7